MSKGRVLEIALAAIQLYILSVIAVGVIYWPVAITLAGVSAVSERIEFSLEVEGWLLPFWIGPYVVGGTGGAIGLLLLAYLSVQAALKGFEHIAQALQGEKE